MKTARDIEEVRAHLMRGGRVAIPTATRCTILTAKHLDYIRRDSDGRGWRLGWPGKKSVYCFEGMVKLV